MMNVITPVRTFIFFAFNAALLAQPGHDEGERRRDFGGPGRPNFMRMHPVMAALDADHDGVVSAQELAAAPQVLKGLDKNGDGVLTADELRPQFGPGRGEERRSNPTEMVDTLMAFDRNGDGVLDKDEVPERMQGVFARGDANHDGKLTRDELTKLAAAQPAAGQGRGEGRGGEGRGEGRGRMGGPPRDPVMAALDTDGDGTVSASEIAASPASLAKLDRNQDGRLTEDEIRPAFGAGGRRNPGEMAAHFMEEWDANGDGKLSKEELPERMRSRFADGDADKDGFLSRAELQALLASEFEGGRR